jgi:DNA replication and repair protein RecF
LSHFQFSRGKRQACCDAFEALKIRFLAGNCLFIKSLRIENLRNLERVDILPHPRFNIIFGSNGAGKTSILESIVVLSRGRSFRTSQASELIGCTGKQFRVYAETVSDDHLVNRVGLERSDRHWRGRKNGQDLAQLSQLTSVLPLVLMEPNSHLLVSGAPEVRRKYLDWGMFHVEHEFLDTYRRYSKILKQRNAALRLRQVKVLDSIDEVFCQLGERLDRMRKAHCAAVSEQARVLLESLSPEMVGFRLEYCQGWSSETLKESLEGGRKGDLLRGATASGPHRGDISLEFNETPARNLLSRGEQKILAATLLLSQAAILSRQGEKPIILLDDLASEFDEVHFENVLARGLQMGGQVWISGIRKFSTTHEHKVFHVERGGTQEMV